MNLFGPWLLPLSGVGTVLLMGGLLTKEIASDRSVKGLGRGAANVGWRLMLLAAVMYFLILERFANRVVLCKSVVHGDLLEGPED